ncbi:hypothetical protein Agub_g15143 [Astrephomene gubernaculifera]|uniref:Inositol-tetrakisphosphate 1-kinase n=1 Tax=Astrephomene gubernaculifera TaxID=47775 RepID=A0AAD3E2L1_9CHLO|nr:hypothetical protein Agub_g15143 [Astrephomene gubernaculifera]
MVGERPQPFQHEDMDVGEQPGTSGRGEAKHFRVGCALLPKKVSRYLTSSMAQVARSRGVELVLLDHTKPLLDQGEYDAIVHKLRPNKDWERNLQEYIKARPGVKVIDSLAGIRIVHNRSTMLLPLRERPEGIKLQKPDCARNGGSPGMCARIQSPTQVEIAEGTSLSEAQAQLRRAGLRPPLLVKPLWTDGREGSHGLAVLHDMAALGRVLGGDVSSALKPPLVVQQFVEHGGVLFKVYVLGMRTVVCRRPSLGDSYLGEEARNAGVLSLPRISCKSSYGKFALAHGSSSSSSIGAGGAGGGTAPGGDAAAAAGVTSHGRARPQATGARCAQSPQQPLQHSQSHTSQSQLPSPRSLSQQQQQQQQQPAVPPEWVTSALAGTLRDKLGLQLFNFDMICPAEQKSPRERLYYVVDINYFPGVDKIPDFENIFVDFLTATCEGEGDASAAAAAAVADSCGGTPGGETQCAGGTGADRQQETPEGDDGDGVSSVSFGKGDLGRVSGAEAPAPAAEATSGGCYDEVRDMEEEEEP